MTPDGPSSSRPQGAGWRAVRSALPLTRFPHQPVRRSPGEAARSMANPLGWVPVKGRQIASYDTVHPVDYRLKLSLIVTGLQDRTGMNVSLRP